MGAAENPTGSHRYGLVLVLVITAVLTVSVVPVSGASRLLSTALSGATAVAALRAAGARARVQQIGLVLALVAVVGAAAAAVTGGSSLTRGILALTNGAFVLLAPLVIVRGLVRRVLDHGVDGQVVAGALAVYMMIGLVFGFFVAAISEFSSTPYFVQHASVNPGEDVYFSFITLSTVGYGDYTPALGIGRGLAILEGVTGQLYLVTVVALLIGNLSGRSTGRRPLERDG